MHVKLGVHVRLFLFLVWSIPHIRYTKILTGLRGFLVIFLLVWFSRFSLCSSWSLLEIARQWSIKETVILTLKPRIHVRIFPQKLLLNISRISFSRREKENQYKSTQKQKIQITILCLQPRRQDGHVGGQNRRIFSRRIYLKIEFSFQKRQVKKKKKEGRNALVLIPQHHDGRRDVTCKSAIGIGKFKLCLQ